MALLALSDDALGVIFQGLRNKLDPGVVVDLGSACHELRALTQVLLPQLKADHDAVAALCRKVDMPNCKALREAKVIQWLASGWADEDLTAADLALLGTLGSLLPALEKLELGEDTGDNPDGVQQLAEGLGAGSLPAVTYLSFIDWDGCGDAGASALAAALGRGALPRLKTLRLFNTNIGDAGLEALVPAFRRMPALEALDLAYNSLGDESLAALVAPPLPEGAVPPPTGVLKKLKRLSLSCTQVTDVGCASLAAALDAGAMPALEQLFLDGPASAVVKAAVKRVGVTVSRFMPGAYPHHSVWGAH
eukprot:scaffold124361_cov63-Phaeocystis_antarctica.AAC.1